MRLPFRNATNSVLPVLLVFNRMACRGSHVRSSVGLSFPSYSDNRFPGFQAVAYAAAGRWWFWMDDPTACPRCEELIDLACAATQRHIEVLTRLQSAIMKREGDLIEALEFEAKEVGHNREQITETYRHHLRTHGGASAGSAA